MKKLAAFALSLGLLLGSTMLSICHTKETTESTQMIQSEVDNNFPEFFYCNRNDKNVRIDFNKISDFYKNMYWAKNADGTPWSDEKINKNLMNSDEIVTAVDNDGDIVGFARILTDESTLVYMLDSYVSENMDSNKTKEGYKKMFNFIMSDERYKTCTFLLAASTHEREVCEELGFKEKDRNKHIYKRLES